MLQDTYLELHLENKVNFEVGSVHRTPRVTNVYDRKKFQQTLTEENRRENEGSSSL